MAVEAADPHAQRAGDEMKVWFRFTPREGWLPYDTEGLWAVSVGPDLARIRSVPFLQDGVAEDDIVRFETDADGRHWSRERVEASDNCTIRILPVPTGPLGPSAEAVHAKFSEFDLGGEVFSEALPFVALNVPADADFAAVKELLRTGADEGWWYFEVGCATQRWRDA